MHLLPKIQEKSIGKDVEKRDPIAIGQNVSGATTTENNMKFPQKNKNKNYHMI